MYAFFKNPEFDVLFVLLLILQNESCGGTNRLGPSCPTVITIASVFKMGKITEGTYHFRL